MLLREGPLEENPWSVSFEQGLLNVASDSGLFRMRTALGWRTPAEVLDERLPFDQKGKGTAATTGRIRAVDGYLKEEVVDREACEAIDRGFRKRCADAVMDSLSRLKTERYPASPAWQRGLRVFLCGGGAETRFFQDVVREAEAHALEAWRTSRFRLLALPTPEGMTRAGVSDDLFRRLAVAHGLSFERVEIGRILPGESVPDAPKVQATRVSEQHERLDRRS